MLNWIQSSQDMKAAQAEHKDYFVLAFWGDFSGAAQRALAELEQFADEYEKLPIYVVDVGKVKDVHKNYNVENVPTVLAIKDGTEDARIEGVQSAAFYARYLAGAAPSHIAGPPKQKTLRVTVYTSPACPACNRVKTYLKNNNIPFRSIDISRDERAARDIARRSGQQAVPQIDINGRIVVGFDQNKLNALLGI